MARESGIETPTIDDLVRLDRTRKGKKLDASKNLLIPAVP
jgi:hypothetical protein